MPVEIFPPGRPPARSPPSALQTAVLFARALMAREPTAALAYFGSEARLLTAGGTEVSGCTAIGSVLGQLTASSQRLEIRPGRTLVADDVALCSQSWRLVSAGSAVARPARRRSFSSAGSSSGRSSSRPLGVELAASVAGTHVAPGRPPRLGLGHK